MEKGKLIPGEKQFVDEGTVSYERACYGERITLKFDYQALENIKQERGKSASISKGFVTMMNLGKSDFGFRKYLSVEDEAFKSFLIDPKTTYFFHLGKSTSERISLEEILLKRLSLRYAEGQYMHPINIQSFISLLIDAHFANMPFDKQLARAWNARLHDELEENIEKKEQSLRENLLAVRQCEFLPTKLQQALWGSWNCVNWCYGKTAVLIGNPERYISSESFREICETERGRCPQEIFGVIFFREPYENDGEYFCIDLRAPNIMVIGPRAVLEQYIGRGIQVVYLEDMTDVQKKIFNCFF